MMQPISHCKVVLNVALEDLLQRRKRNYFYYINLETLYTASKIDYLILALRSVSWHSCRNLQHPCPSQFRDALRSRIYSVYDFGVVNR